MGLNEDVWHATHRLCDKCGRPVPPKNDLTYLLAATGIRGTALLPALWYARHVLPVRDDDGALICEGSPSRRQYLAGEPRDTRGYPYISELEPIIREAWRSLQAAAKEESVSKSDR